LIIGEAAHGLGAVLDCAVEAFDETRAGFYADFLELNMPRSGIVRLDAFDVRRVTVGTDDLGRFDS
jgi:hypothetical protein